VRAEEPAGEPRLSGPRTCPSTSAGRGWAWKYPINVDLGDAGKLTGFFNLMESHEYWVKIKWHWFMDFSVKAKLLETLGNDFNLTHTMDVTESFTWEKQIGEVQLPRISFAIGPVPVWITPVLSLSVFVSANGKAHLVTSVSQSARLNIGCEYDNGWKNLCSFTNTYDFQKPALTLYADAKAGLKVKEELNFYDSVGVYLSQSPTLKFHADIEDNPWWYLRLGVDAGIGVHGEILGEDLGDKEWPLGEIWGKTLAQARGSYAADKSPPTTTVSGAGDTWRNTPVKLTFTADDGDGSGVKSTLHSVDGGSWSSGDSLTIPAPENTSIDHVVEYYSVDEVGNTEKTKSCHVKIDTILPACTVAGADDAWHVTPVKLTFTGTDNVGGSGISGTQFSLDGGAWTDGASLTINTPKIHDVKYRAVDKAGNIGAASTCTVKWGGDSTPPTTTAVGADDLWHNHAVTVTFSAVDNPGGYGVDFTEYRLGTGVWTKGTSVTLDTNGDHVVSYRSTDVIGNVEEAKTCHVKLDFWAPQTSAIASVQPVTDAATGLKKYVGPKVWFDLTANDDGGSTAASGVAYSEFKLDTVTALGVVAGVWTRGMRIPAGDGGLAPGRYILSYRSTDNAGNVETVKSMEFLADSGDVIPPTTRCNWSITWESRNGIPADGWGGGTILTPASPAPRFTLTAIDNVGGSGVAYTEYKFDEMKDQPPYTTVVLAGPWTRGAAGEAPGRFMDWGLFRMSYRSVDAAGNVETTNTFTYYGYVMPPGI
jgi:hypothetical protein